MERTRKAAEKQEGDWKAERIAEYRGKLDESQKEALRVEARTEIEASGEFRPAFITEMLLEFKETEIIPRIIFRENDPG